MRLLLSQYEPFIKALSVCITDLGEKYGLSKGDRFLVAMELGAYDARVETGIPEILVEMERLKIEFLLEEAYMRGDDLDEFADEPG